ncbi:MAG: MobA/MobL family protein [Fusobacterium gastrosuis]|uniref:MobA/MobL family protein n=1 Tax=Fusobacterium gastrosuis TaxID=1755100 RepID=UPI0029771356|nr:MobA/MobL family protein [Fusobacteriaceae bacterium]MDY4011001.1 MobA/MobL family protein [Fusobacterium gastrosuis]MDY5713547.1 MobA/MobL family protein [Fusobacterium gastrosuis]
MAEYRLSYKIGKLGYAKSHAEYILREGNYTSKKEDLIYKEYGNMNFTDGTSAVKFWEYADTYERANSIVYREMELNIPNEFNYEQAKELIFNFVKKELGEGYPYTYAIHESINKENERNLHCHLMFSERENDGIDRKLDKFFKRANSQKPELGGAMKNREWQTKDRLRELRKSWEVEQNNLLEKYGFEARVDCRSLRDIRRELLEKEKFELASKYDREPINISGRILYKVDKKIQLSESEQQKYNKFLESKKRRLKKIRDFEKKDIKAEIEKIEKQDSTERALNIVSKGKYFKLKKDEYSILKKLKTYPENQILVDRKNEIKDALNTIKIEWENKNKYIGIVEQLERNKTRDLLKAKELFKEKFNENYISKDEEKIIEKYKNKDILDLKIKLQNFQNENVEYKVVNIITNYKYNEKLVDVFNMQKQKENIEQKYQEAALYNPSELKVLRAEKEEISATLQIKSNALQKSIEDIDEREIKNLSDKINKSREIEIKVIKEIISKNNQNYTDLDYEKERLMLLNRHCTLEKIYKREIQKEEKTKEVNKKIYSIANEIVAIESLLNNNYKEKKEVKDLVEKNLADIEKKIRKNNERIKVAEEVVRKTDIIIKSFNKKYKMSGIEMIAIGKLSKNEYWKLYKERENLKKDTLKKEKTLESMGVVSFGKNVLKKSIEINKQELIKLENREKELVIKYSKDSRFQGEVKKLKGYYDKVLKDYKEVSYNLKVENTINYNLKANVANKERTVKTVRNIPQQRLKTRKSNGINDIRKNIGKILAADNSEIRSNLDINLKREREYEWER